MYKIEFTKVAKKQIKKISRLDQLKISAKIQSLSINPKPNGHKVLKGNLAQFYRLRSGNYRVVYSIEEDKLVVLIVKIAHRKEVYE